LKLRCVNSAPIQINYSIYTKLFTLPNFVIEKVLFFSMFLFFAVILSNYAFNDTISTAITTGYWFLIILSWLLNRYKTFNHLYLYLYFATVIFIIALMLVNDGIHDSAILIFPVLIMASGFFLKQRVYRLSLLFNLLVILCISFFQYTNLIVNDFNKFVDMQYISNIFMTFVGMSYFMYLIIKYVDYKEKKLKAVNDTKDRFLNILAHDLKNPFQSLIGISSYLKEEYEDLSNEEKLESITVLENSIKEQYNLLDELLKWGKLQSGVYKNELKKLLLKKIVDEVITSVSIIGHQKNVIIVNEIPDEFSMTGDSMLLSTMIRNIISNSLKFAHEGSHVKVSAAYENSKVYLTIEDNGIGMNEDQISILKKRTESNITLNMEGELDSGLGLLLVGEVLKIHNGQIDIESEVGKGSKFIVSLPK
ncbi:MAG: HAMP domain-containing histidine kinase, partial [Melioribacteraceae bacterium]|nr:HAMP domain-containing histidine kinase [Melioribacteraceae bacterium]